jgi:hypothetical protein
VVKRLLQIAIIWISLFVLFVGSAGAEPGPLEKFFRSLKHVFTSPQHKTSSHQSSRKHTAEETKSDQTPNKTASTPPAERNTRVATRATLKKDSKEDFPYGIPVPGKKGFVTSPFAPDSGYIDVHAFHPGTAVKDPYTGKIFLTP